MERIDIGKELEGMMASGAVFRHTIREELPRSVLSEMAGEFKLKQANTGDFGEDCNNPDTPRCD